MITITTRTIRHESSPEREPVLVNVGRNGHFDGALGNPFALTKGRRTCVEAYAHYLAVLLGVPTSANDAAKVAAHAAAIADLYDLSIAKGWNVPSSQDVQAAWNRIRDGVDAGYTIRFKCACKANELCHADAITELAGEFFEDA